MTPPSSAEYLKRHVLELCRPECEGRLAGTAGEARAADYLVQELASLQVEPAFAGSYSQPVEIQATRFLAPARLTVGELNLRHRIDFGESWITSGGTYEGELAVAREGQELAVPLSGKVILIPEKPSEFDLEATVAGGLEQGIRGLLFEEGEPRWFRKSSSLLDGAGIPVFRIRKGVAEALAARSGSQVSIHLPISPFKAQSRNLLGLVRAASTTARTIALTAHYDHIGDDPGEHRFPGALDNATGVAVVLELARRLRTRALPFNVLIGFLTGEESGLLGARQLLKEPPLPLSGVINIDVLGLDPVFRQVRIGQIAEESWLSSLAQGVLAEHGIEAKRLPGRDDASVFLSAGLPTIGFGEYRLHGLGPAIHTPDDRPEAVHLQPLLKTLELVGDILERVPPGRP